MLDSTYLTPEQVRALAPSRAKVGSRYSLPEQVSRQFAPALTSDGDAFYRMRPENATTARLDAEVLAVTDGRVEVRVSGTLNGRKSFGKQGRMETNAVVDGMMVFRSGGEPLRLMVVCEGRYVNTHSNAKGRVGGLVEWQAADADKPRRN